MFRWQLRHVMKTMFQTLKAAACKTYGDGMEVLMACSHELSPSCPAFSTTTCASARRRGRRGEGDASLPQDVEPTQVPQRRGRAHPEAKTRPRAHRRSRRTRRVSHYWARAPTPPSSSATASLFEPCEITPRSWPARASRCRCPSAPSAAGLPRRDPGVGEDGVAVDKRLLIKGHVTTNHEAIDAS